MTKTFKTQLDKAYDRKVLGTLEKKVRSVALVVDSALVFATPVDTGRARSNWQVSLNEPLLNEVEWNETDKKEESYVPPRENDAIAGISGFKITDTVLITNNLPYIEALNKGSSKQAPKGFVDEAIGKGKRAARSKGFVVRRGKKT